MDSPERSDRLAPFLVAVVIAACFAAAWLLVRSAVGAPAPLPRPVPPPRPILAADVCGAWTYIWPGDMPGSLVLLPGGTLYESYAGQPWMGRWDLERQSPEDRALGRAVLRIEDWQAGCDPSSGSRWNVWVHWEGGALVGDDYAMRRGR